MRFRMTSTEQNITRAIGNFYLEKIRRDLVFEKDTELIEDMYAKLYRELDDLKIKNIEFDEGLNTVGIYLERPGHLIGLKGSNVSALEKYLQERLKIENLKIKVFEFSIEDYLYPINPYSFEGEEEDVDSDFF